MDARHRIFSIFIQYMLILFLFQVFSYLLRDITRVLPCVTCTEDENYQGCFMGDRKAEQLFPREVEQQR